MKNDDKDDIVLFEQFGSNRHRTQAVFDGERNLSINCPELRCLKWYLLLVGQWYPKEWNLTVWRSLYHLWQICVTLGVWAYFIYSLGFFGNSSQEYFQWFPVSSIEDIIWESRWVISHHVGLYYLCVSRHMEDFLQGSCLTLTLWKDTSRYLKRIIIAMIIFVFLVPVFLRPVELSYSLANSRDSWWIVMDTVYLGLDRLVTAPIFLVFVFEAYILVRVVKGFAKRIETWPKDYKKVPGSGMRAAKLEFVRTHSLIGSVGKSFQLYLSLHFFFLLITAFLGVFACAEQIETALKQNHSFFTPGSPKYYKRMKIASLMTQPLTKIKMVPTESSKPYLRMAAGLKADNPRQWLVNVTLKKEVTENYSEEREKQMFVEVGIEATLKILESIILYMIPLTLMLRLQTKLGIVRQTILYSDIFEQQENGYLFQDEGSIRIMAEFVDTCKGITIFGYKMPLFRAFLLSVFAPFLTALTTFLFGYIHVKRRY